MPLLINFHLDRIFQVYKNSCVETLRIFIYTYISKFYKHSVPIPILLQIYEGICIDTDTFSLFFNYELPFNNIEIVQVSKTLHI